MNNIYIFCSVYVYHREVTFLPPPPPPPPFRVFTWRFPATMFTEAFDYLETLIQAGRVDHPSAIHVLPKENKQDREDGEKRKGDKEKREEEKDKREEEKNKEGEKEKEKNMETETAAETEKEKEANGRAFTS